MVYRLTVLTELHFNDTNSIVFMQRFSCCSCLICKVYMVFKAGYRNCQGKGVLVPAY